MYGAVAYGTYAYGTGPATALQQSTLCSAVVAIVPETTLGGIAYLSVEFRQLGLLVNPASLAAHLRTADGAVAVYTLIGGQIVQGRNNVADVTATGAFYLLYATTVPGEVSQTWYSGTVPIGQGKFHVSPPLA